MKKDDIEIRKLNQLTQNFTHNVRKTRIKRGYTQEQLGELSGLGRIRIVEIEGQRYTPTLPTMNRIAIALGVEVYQLLMPNIEDTDK